ncbi:ArsR/SmtB family transcription factor [Kitasatospora sp. NPDC057015]|uniref:ArsR/SmtB family transcription factor n=1 Tax=Kitasatospora sp. NPDC057015 TaxID=3346001 RepID=UPI0036401B34
MRIPSHPARQDIQLAGLFHALSDPVRLAIVAQLGAAGERYCSELDVRLSKSTLSHHLKVLREAGVTWTRIEGTRRLMALRREDLDALFPGLLPAVLDAATPTAGAAGRA